MPDGSIDPASLEGDALTRWYLRSPADIEQERQAAEAQRYQSFFGSRGVDPDPGFDPGFGTPAEDVDPGSTSGPPAPTEDIDPGYAGDPGAADQQSAIAAGGEKRRFSSMGGQPPTNLAGSRSIAAANNSQVAATNLTTPIYRDPTTRPLPTFFSSLFGGPVPMTSPEGNVIGYYDHQAAKAGLGITAQYAAIAPLFHPAGWMDSALAEGGSVAANVARQAIDGPGPRFVLNFLEREAWQGKSAAEQVERSLSDAAKAAIRRVGRARFAQANDASAAEMGAQVHHSDPLEYAHLKPNTDPNRLANLWGLRDQVHQIANSEWTAFRAALNGRVPTQAEIMAAKLRIDRMVAPYIQRAGASRPGPPLD